MNFSFAEPKEINYQQQAQNYAAAGSEAAKGVLQLADIATNEIQQGMAKQKIADMIGADMQKRGATPTEINLNKQYIKSLKDPSQLSAIMSAYARNSQIYDKNLGSLPPNDAGLGKNIFKRPQAGWSTEDYQKQVEADQKLLEAAKKVQASQKLQPYTEQQLAAGPLAKGKTAEQQASEIDINKLAQPSTEQVRSVAAQEGVKPEELPEMKSAEELKGRSAVAEVSTKDLSTVPGRTSARIAAAGQPDAEKVVEKTTTDITGQEKIDAANKKADEAMKFKYAELAAKIAHWNQDKDSAAAKLKFAWSKYSGQKRDDEINNLVKAYGLKLAAGKVDIDKDVLGEITPESRDKIAVIQSDIQTLVDQLQGTAENVMPEFKAAGKKTKATAAAKSKGKKWVNGQWVQQ